MNWTMTLRNERYKGKVEGESLRSIHLILEKHALGQPVEKIAEDLLEETDYVGIVCRYADENKDVTADEVLKRLEESSAKAGA